MSSRRNRGGGGGHGDGGEERWLLPYADMITLLLGLFIVLFAMSSIDAKQFDHVKRSLSETFNGAILDNSGGVMDGSNGIMDPNAATAAPTPSATQLQQAARQTGAKFEDQAQQLKALVKENGLGNDVRVTTNERGIKINLAGDALFAPGSWEIRPEFQAKLKRIEQQLAAFHHPIEIAGHTDGIPYTGPWGNRGLSSNRANEVAAFFERLGYPRDQIKTVGYGDTKPVERPQNPTQANPKNRRIEITVLQAAADSGLTETERIAKLAEQAQAMSPERIVQPVEQQLAEEFDTAVVEDLVASTKGTG